MSASTAGQQGMRFTGQNGSNPSLYVANPALLQELHLAVSTVSDAGLRPLSRLSRLAVLNASMCFKLTPK